MNNLYKLIIALLLIFITNNLFSQYSLWTWGNNDYGQLGNDKPEDEPLPVIINDDGDWEKVYSYYAIKKDGTLWTWGNSNVNPVNETHGSEIRLFDDSKWKEIITSSDGRTTYGIKLDGSLWTWGSYHKGWVIVKDSIFKDPNSFIKKPFLVDRAHYWNKFSFGNLFCLGINNNGELFFWGENRFSGFKINEGTVDSIIQVDMDTDWEKVSSFHNLIIGLKYDGSLWVWGMDVFQLFDERASEIYSKKKLGEYNCIDFLLSNHGFVIIDNRGDLLSIGRYMNLYTRGSINRINYFEHKVKKFGKTDFVTLAAYGDSDVLVWGMNEGLKFTSLINEEMYYFPVKISDSRNLIKITDLAQIGNGFVAVDTSGNLVAWGNNSFGELTNGKSSIYNEPINIMPNKYFTDISSGMNHGVAIDEYGMMWVWGDNSENQLGIVNNSYVNAPIPINNDLDWEKVYTFRNSTFAIKKDGSLWAWGDNEYGKLGVGHAMSVFVPTKVNEVGPWKQVYSSPNHSIALKEDGTIWGWGVGKDAIGVGIDTIFVPQQIGVDNDWMDIACGGIYSPESSFSVALKTDSTLWGWGYLGELGPIDFNNNIKSSPTKIYHNWWGNKFIDLESGERFVTAISANKLIYILSDYHGHSSSVDDIGSITSKRSLNTNYKGIIILVDKDGRLLASKSRLPLGPELSWAKRKVLANYFYLQSEENDWVKAVAGRDHIITLRGEYTTDVQQTRNLVNANVYPNPSESNINIDLNTFYSKIRISIYDVYGKLVLEDKSYNTDRVTINHNLPHGAYILQCMDDYSLIVDEIIVVE